MTLDRWVSRALIPKIGGCRILQLCTYGTSFELCIRSAGLVAAVLHLPVEKLGQNMAKGHWLKSNNSCDRKSADSQTDRQTDRQESSDFMICPLLCYDSGTDKIVHNVKLSLKRSTLSERFKIFVKFSMFKSEFFIDHLCVRDQTH